MAALGGRRRSHGHIETGSGRGDSQGLGKRFWSVEWHCEIDGVDLVKNTISHHNPHRNCDNVQAVMEHDLAHERAGD